MRLQVPFLPDGEYDLRLVVKPLEKKMGLTIGLVSEGNPFHAILDYYNHYHALEQVDGLDLNARPASGSNSGRVDKADLLTLNQNNTIVCRVRKNGVTIEVNEKPLIAWKGSPQQLSRNGYWNMPVDRSLFIGGFSRFECSRLTLTPLTGTVQPVPPWRLTTAASQSLAAGLLGISEDTMKRLATTWSLSLNDEFGSDGEVALDLLPRSEVVSTAQGLITFDDIQFLTTLTCPIRVTLARLDSKSCSVENVQRLAAMKNLRRLYIAENRAMPANFTELLGANRSLRELVLGPQKLKEQQVTELCRIATLQRLLLNYTDLSDESVRIIANSLPKLESLHIGHMGPQSRLTNDCVKSVSALGSLKELSVRDSKAIDDKCVDDLLKLRNLTALWIDGTSITQSGFERLKSKRPATMITWKP